jgi:hypothetical protein
MGLVVIKEFSREEIVMDSLFQMLIVVEIMVVEDQEMTKDLDKAGEIVIIER